MAEEMYSPPEVAKITGLSAKTIRDKVNKGEIAAQTIVSSSTIGKGGKKKQKRTIYLIPKSEIKKIILSRVGQEAIDFVCQ